MRFEDLLPPGRTWTDDEWVVIRMANAAVREGASPEKMLRALHADLGLPPPQPFFSSWDDVRVFLAGLAVIIVLVAVVLVASGNWPW